MTFRSCGSERWIIVCDENWFMRKAKNNKTYAGWLTFITLASDAEQQNVFYKVKLFSQKRLICSYLQTLTELLLYPQFQHFSHVAYLRLGIGTLFHSVPRCSTISFCLTSLFSPSFFLGPGTIFSVFALGEKATCQNQETERPPNFQGCGRSRTQIEFSLIWFSYKTKGNKQSRDFETDYLCLIFCSSQSQTRKPNASTLSRPCYDCCSTTDSPESSKSEKPVDPWRWFPILHFHARWDGSRSAIVVSTKRASAHISRVSKPFWRTHANRDNCVLSLMFKYRLFSTNLGPKSTFRGWKRHAQSRSQRKMRAWNSHETLEAFSKTRRNGFRPCQRTGE